MGKIRSGYRDGSGLGKMKMKMRRQDMASKHGICTVSSVTQITQDYSGEESLTLEMPY